jgi:mitogen-activated protein kinase organizer 1
VLISGGYDASVRMWDIRQHTSHKPIMVLSDAKDSISAVLAAQDGGVTSYEILAGSVDGRVRTYDIRMGRVEEDVIGASVTSLARTRDGKGVLVGCLDSSIRLMDRDNGGLLKRYEGFTNTEFRLESTFGANERYVLCGNEVSTTQSAGRGAADGEVVVWDTVSGKVVERVRIPGNASENRKRVVGNDGKEKERQNIISCLAWKENGRGEQWCCAGTDGVVTVFGPP